MSEELTINQELTFKEEGCPYCGSTEPHEHMLSDALPQDFDNPKYEELVAALCVISLSCNELDTEPGGLAREAGDHARSVLARFTTAEKET